MHRVEVVRSGSGHPDAVERILRELPEWFGIESSIRDYVEAATRLDNYLAMVDGDPEPAGVLLIDRHFDPAAEIHLLAVTPRLHRTGIGKALVENAEADLARSGVRYLQVKTLGPSRPDPHYDATRAFYLRCGFCPLEEIHGLWPGNPCLVMVKSLTP
jgi:GNAT superfamily N-acetyltransferase